MKSERGLGLGIDAGGTQTRWSLVLPSGEVVASGQDDGLTALEMGSAAGRQHLGDTLARIGRQARSAGAPQFVVAGMTGFGGDNDKNKLISILAESIGVDDSAISLRSDVEIAYLDIFEPGEGYLVYSGTGSIGAYIDAEREFHRVGGQGGILDDAGSGFWIGIQAMRRIWREEDERPGAWRESILARAVFDRVGGSDWGASRRFLYEGGFEANRGKIGQLALAVASAASAGDGEAMQILESAGRELARLARIMTERFGVRPIAMGGRVFTLHPAIEASVRSELPVDTKLESRVSDPHLAAARIAAKRALSK